MGHEKSILEKMIVYKNGQLKYFDKDCSANRKQASKILHQLDRLLYQYYKALNKSTN